MVHELWFETCSQFFGESQDRMTNPRLTFSRTPKPPFAALTRSLGCASAAVVDIFTPEGCPIVTSSPRVRDWPCRLCADPAVHPLVDALQAGPPFLQLSRLKRMRGPSLHRTRLLWSFQASLPPHSPNPSLKTIHCGHLFPPSVTRPPSIKAAKSCRRHRRSTQTPRLEEAGCRGDGNPAPPRAPPGA